MYSIDIFNSENISYCTCVESSILSLIRVNIYMHFETEIETIHIWAIIPLWKLMYSLTCVEDQLWINTTRL